MQVVHVRRITVIIIAAITATGCAVNSALERLSQARHLAAELLVQFTRATDAANTAVMADTDDASVMAVHAQIMALSRRNTNVRSLALSLNEKGKLTHACEDSLRALRDALAKRGFSGSR